MGEDAKFSKPQIADWGTLKKKLKDWFFPTNVVSLAKESLKRLTQTSPVREYVKEFSSLMFDIRNISEKDKLFNFFSSLRDGHKHNSGDREFMIYPLLWLLRIAWWITR